jgi:hypothetical protein
MEGSTKLCNSDKEGRRQPFWPPTSFSTQVRRATLHLALEVCGDFSHTSPVSLSNTPSLFKDGRTTNRCAAVIAVGGFLTAPGTSTVVPDRTVAPVNPPSSKTLIVRVRDRLISTSYG